METKLTSDLHIVPQGHEIQQQVLKQIQYKIIPKVANYNTVHSMRKVTNNNTKSNTNKRSDERTYHLAANQHQHIKMPQIKQIKSEQHKNTR
jgi:hypothetical protein